MGETAAVKCHTALPIIKVIPPPQDQLILHITKQDDIARLL